MSGSRRSLRIRIRHGRRRMDRKATGEPQAKSDAANGVGPCVFRATTPSWMLEIARAHFFHDVLIALPGSARP